MRCKSGFAMVVALAIVASSGCQTEQRLTMSDEAALRQALDTEMRAANAADVASWTALYTPDAMVLRPHAPPVEGREAIQRWLVTLPPISHAKGEGVEAVGSGNLAYLRGGYRMTFSFPGVPTPIEEQGKFIQIYRRQGDGSWRITREIYNSDLPLPFPPPVAPTP
jgi:ketosteroid isomerase-like protein